VAGAGGRVVKYIGDASLLVFPEQEVRTAVGELLAMKREIEDYFASDYPALALTLSADLGKIIVVELEPIAAADVLGHTVNTACRLGVGIERGGFAVSQAVYERLGDELRNRFQVRSFPKVYVAR
jgi:class 3 adenylate cyclase